MAVYNHQQARKKDLSWISGEIKRLQDDGWYGTLSIVMEGGNLQRVRRDASLLPPSKEGRRERHPPRPSRSMRD